MGVSFAQPEGCERTSLKASAQRPRVLGGLGVWAVAQVSLFNAERSGGLWRSLGDRGGLQEREVRHYAAIPYRSYTCWKTTPAFALKTSGV